jgi:hypothetical protein
MKAASELVRPARCSSDELPAGMADALVFKSMEADIPTPADPIEKGFKDATHFHM